MSDVLDCNVCGAPAAVVLPRGHGDADEFTARRALVTAWRQRMGVYPPADPSVVGIVRVFDADVIFLQEIGYLVEAGWCEAGKVDAPAWWVNQRRRFALRWDCCAVVGPIPGALIGERNIASGSQGH